MTSEQSTVLNLRTVLLSSQCYCALLTPSALLIVAVPEDDQRLHRPRSEGLWTLQRCETLWWFIMSMLSMCLQEQNYPTNSNFRCVFF